MAATSSKAYLRPAEEEGRRAVGESGTWAFLFSDIEGSTQLLLRLGEKYDDILEQHRNIVRAAIARHGGDEQGTEGDSFVVAFRDVTSAALTAIEAQRALSQAQWPSDVELRVRMGLHVGEARLDPVGGFNGLTLHAAARVMSAAHGGQIVGSRPCVELLAPDVATARPLGSYQLKDLPAPIELFQLVAPGLETQFPPLRGTALVRGGDRRRVRTPLRGRQRELDRLVAQLAEPGLVTLIGPAGTGKTRLTVEALDLLDTEGAHSLFVDLAVVADVERTVWRVADALGIEGEDDALDSVVAALGSGPTLLALDNCEHLLRGVAPLVDELLQRCPNLTVLCTSREALGVWNETIIPIPPLDTSGSGEPSDALRLFLDRASDQGVAVPEEEWPAVDEIVRRLDGIPLAIELAAGLTSTLSPTEIAQRLTSRFRLLGGRGGSASDRHQTMLSAVQWGYELLQPDEQRALRALSVCAGPFDLRTAEALLDAGETPVEPLDHLHRLIRTSWLTRQSTGFGSRYRLLETFKAFGEDQAARVGDLELHRQRHAAHFLALAKEQAPRATGADHVAGIAELDEHFEDIWIALSWAVEHPSLLTEAVATYVALVRYWQTRPDWSEVERLAQRLFDSLEANPEQVDFAPRCELSAMIGFYRMLAGDIESALRLTESARDLADRSGNAIAQIRALRVSGQVYGRAGHLYRAIEFSTACIELAERENLRSFLPLAYQDRAGSRAATEGIQPAIDDARAGIDAAIAGDDTVGLVMGRLMLASLLAYLGRDEESLAELITAEELLPSTKHQMAALFVPMFRSRLTDPPEVYRRVTLTAVEAATRLGKRASQVDAYTFATFAALQDHDLDAAVGLLPAIEDAASLGKHDVALAHIGVANARGDTSATRRLLLNELARAFAAGSRGSCTELVWLLALWDFLDGELRERARDVATALVPVFGMTREVELFTDLPRPFGESTQPPPLTDLDEIVKEILEAATGIEPVYGALQAPA